MILADLIGPAVIVALAISAEDTRVIMALFAVGAIGIGVAEVLVHLADTIFADMTAGAVLIGRAGPQGKAVAVGAIFCVFADNVSAGIS